MHAETTTDWITAVAAVFAAVGTVGAVIVALWQSVGQDKVHLHVRAWFGDDEDAEGGGVLTVVASNPRRAPVNVVTAGINAAHKTFIPSAQNARGLPAKLAHKDSVVTRWTASELKAFEREAGPLLYTGFMSELDGGFWTHLPGGSEAPWWRRSRKRPKHNIDLGFVAPTKPPWA